MAFLGHLKVKILKTMWNFVKIAGLPIFCPKFGSRYKYYPTPLPRHFGRIYIPGRMLDLLSFLLLIKALTLSSAEMVFISTLTPYTHRTTQAGEYQEGITEQFMLNKTC